MIKIQSPLKIQDAAITLPGSKSISNRILILDALSGNQSIINNLSVADDTIILKKLIAGQSGIEHCGDGGTTSRFLLALRCLQNRNSIITGSDALISRPIAPLIHALKHLGARFEFQEKIDSLPVKILEGVKRGGFISIPGNISSQFISALMMIAPLLEGGLVIRLENEVVSASYIQTTADLMLLFGIEPQIEGETIVISQGCYNPVNYTVSSDWSSAGYWYAIAALLPGSDIILNDLIADGLQPDERVLQLMKAFGVNSIAVENNIRIASSEVNTEHAFQFDFTDCPDLVQTFAVLAAIKGMSVKLTGLNTLRSKETDRIKALDAELSRAGVNLIADDYSIEILSGVNRNLIESSVFKTYGDHRMAMALSLISCSGVPVTIDNRQVVNKSFPDYWNEMMKAGFICS